MFIILFILGQVNFIKNKIKHYKVLKIFTNNVLF